MNTSKKSSIIKKSGYIFAALSGIFIGLVYLKFSYFLMLFILLPLFFILIWAREEWGILTIIIMTASVIYEEQLPVIQTAVGNFHLIDLFLFFLLLSIFLKKVLNAERRLQQTPLDGSLIIFYLFAVLSTIIAVTVFSVSIRNALSELRIITYYLVFFLVTNLVRDEKQLKRLIHGLNFVAAIVVLFMILQAILGTSLMIIPARVESLSTMGEIRATTIRVITPGNSLIFVMFIVACCSLIIQKSRYNFIVMTNILLLGLGLIIGFNRNLWIPGILVMILFFFLVTAPVKIRYIGLLSLMVFGLTALTIYAHISGGKLKNYTESAYDRLITITRGQDLIQRDTLIDRIIENQFAVEKIKNQPLLGIGLGNDYRKDIDWNPKLNAYIHNGFLWILMKIGIFGFIAFMCFLIHAICRGLRYWKQIQDDYLRCVAIGFMLACLGFMMSALMNPVFMQWHSSPIIGLMLGGNELIFRLTRKGT